jgi:hypothetical protein
MASASDKDPCWSTCVTRSTQSVDLGKSAVHIVEVRASPKHFFYAGVPATHPDGVVEKAQAMKNRYVHAWSWCDQLFHEAFMHTDAGMVGEAGKVITYRQKSTEQPLRLIDISTAESTEAFRASIHAPATLAVRDLQWICWNIHRQTLSESDAAFWTDTVEPWLRAAKIDGFAHIELDNKFGHGPKCQIALLDAPSVVERTPTEFRAHFFTRDLLRVEGGNVTATYPKYERAPGIYFDPKVNYRHSDPSKVSDNYLFLKEYRPYLTQGEKEDARADKLSENRSERVRMKRVEENMANSMLSVARSSSSGMAMVLRLVEQQTAKHERDVARRRAAALKRKQKQAGEATESTDGTTPAAAAAGSNDNAASHKKKKAKSTTASTAAAAPQ